MIIPHLFKKQWDEESAHVVFLLTLESFTTPASNYRCNMLVPQDPAINDFLSIDSLWLPITDLDDSNGCQISHQW